MADAGIYVVKLNYYDELDKKNVTETIFVSACSNHEVVDQVENYYGERNIIALCIYGTDETFVTPKNALDLANEALLTFEEE